MKIVLSVTTIVNVRGLVVRWHDTCDQVEGRRELSISPVAEGVIIKVEDSGLALCFNGMLSFTQSDVADAIGRLQSSRNSDTWGVIDSPKSSYNSE